jgi:hypothetical protein
MSQHFVGYAVCSHRTTKFLNMMGNEDFSVIAQIMWSTKFVGNITYLSVTANVSTVIYTPQSCLQAYMNTVRQTG